MREKPREPPDRQLRAGQALTIGRAILGVVSIGVIWGFGKAAFEPMEQDAMNHTTHEAATTGLNWTAEFFHNFLFVALAVTVLGTIAFTVYQNRGVR